MIKFLKRLFCSGEFPVMKECVLARPKPKGREHKPMISGGLAYKWVTKTDAFGQPITISCGYEIDDEHPVTIEFRRLEEVKHKAMLFEPKQPEYITVTIDRKYLGKWGKE